jgi:subtilisin family serine protease
MLQKGLLSGLAILLLFSTADAQFSRWIVVLKDKNNSPFSINRPQEFLSNEALKRRARFKIRIDETDLPVNPSYIQQVIAQGPATYISQSKWLNQILIRCSDSNTLNKIRSLSFVKSVNAVRNFTVNDEPTDKFKETIVPASVTAAPSGQVVVAGPPNRYNYGNSFEQVAIHKGEFLHNKGFTGKGIRIAILDAGFQRYKNIKAFDSIRAENRFLGDKDFVDFDGNVNEDDSHGEYCLSVIGSNVPGVMVGTAPEASFYLVRTEDVFSEMPIEEHNWVAGAEFADSVGADMISSSLGYTKFDNATFNHTYDDFYKNTTMCSIGATMAAHKGMIVTNSAGNSGADSWKYLGFPSDGDSVCAVAATDVNGNIAFFSSYGYPGKVKPNIASVGSSTAVYTSFGPSYASGTSFSNPNINGLIACLWQAFPKFNNYEILKAVYASSDRVRNPDNRYGYGLPNMKRAYIILRHEENNSKYGLGNWMKILHNDQGKIGVEFAAQIEGKVKITLLDKYGTILETREMITEEQEEYNVTFSNQTNAVYLRYTDERKENTLSLSELVVKQLPVPLNLAY